MTDYLCVTGPAMQAYLPDMARLRLKVFYDYPYLYEGEIEYEADYLQAYLAKPDCFFVLALDKGVVVGAASCLPLSHAKTEFQQPFLKAGWDLSKGFYFAESVLLPEYRGQGAGSIFFRLREEIALQQEQYKYLAFCTVDRQNYTELKPENYHTLDNFWHLQGFKATELTARFAWRDRGEPRASMKNMPFWIKSITA
ncbi:hypothetical protein OA92_18780 [Marinomonas sp. SBI22]|nr:hypothetical protein OA92_18780 [Marinomonas sp. SBI22]KZM41195.1 hypothetical protein OA91_18015 [Marinomonas sp. SBI8L]